MLFKNKNCEKCGNEYDQTYEECPICKTKDRNFDSLNIPKQIFWVSQMQQIALFLMGLGWGGLAALQLLSGTVLSWLQDKGETVYLFWANTVAYLLLAIILFLITFNRKSEYPKHFKKWDSYLYGIAYAATLVAISTVWSYLTTYVFKVGANINQNAVVDVVKYNPPLALLVLGVIGATCEEFTYRVGLYSLLRRLNKYAAIIISSVIFGLIHLSFDSPDLATEFIQLPNYIIAGAIFAISYEHKGLPCAVTAHVAYDLFAMIGVLLRK